METQLISESLVLDAVLDLLAAHHVVAWRMNVGAVKLEDRYVQFGVRGFADILAIPVVRGNLHGIPCAWCAPWFIETKSERGRQSAEQRSFEKQVRDAGAEYFLVRSVDEMELQLRRHGVIR